MYGTRLRGAASIGGFGVDAIWGHVPVALHRSNKLRRREIAQAAGHRIHVRFRPRDQTAEGKMSTRPPAWHAAGSSRSISAANYSNPPHTAQRYAPCIPAACGLCGRRVCR